MGYVYGTKECYGCGKTTTGGNRIVNRDIDGNLIGVICSYCRKDIIYDRSKRRMKIIRIRKGKALRNVQRIEFRGRSIYLGWTLKKGICTKCGRSVKNYDIPYTTLHHLEYLIIFPWFATIELCRRCHNKQHSESWERDTHGKYVLM